MRLPWKRRPAKQDEQIKAQKEAKAALEAAQNDLAETVEVVKDVKVRVKWLRLQREENHFAPAVIEMFKKGR